MDGVMGIADYQCRQILGRHYHRLSPMLPPNKVIAMDAVKRIPDLIAIAEAVDLSPTIAWLKSTWQ